MLADPGREALQAIDKLLSDRPKKIGHDFSDATRRMSAFRDLLIGRVRKTQADADRRDLARANAVLSVIVGSEFPLGEVPWPHIEQAREELAALVRSAR